MCWALYYLVIIPVIVNVDSDCPDLSPFHAMLRVLSNHLHCSQRPADVCIVLFGGWTCMGADGAVAVVGCIATIRVPGCSNVIIGTPIAVLVVVALDMPSWVALDMPSWTALIPDFLHLWWQYRQRTRTPRKSKITMAISNGPIVPRLFSSKLINPKLFEVFSTSGFVLEFPISYTFKIISESQIKKNNWYNTYQSGIPALTVQTVFSESS